MLLGPCPRHQGDLAGCFRRLCVLSKRHDGPFDLYSCRAFRAFRLGAVACLGFGLDLGRGDWMKTTYEVENQARAAACGKQDCKRASVDLMQRMAHITMHRKKLRRGG